MSSCFAGVEIPQYVEPPVPAAGLSVMPGMPTVLDLQLNLPRIPAWKTPSGEVLLTGRRNAYRHHLPCEPDSMPAHLSRRPKSELF